MCQKIVQAVLMNGDLNSRLNVQSMYHFQGCDLRRYTLACIIIFQYFLLPLKMMLQPHLKCSGIFFSILQLSRNLPISNLFILSFRHIYQRLFKVSRRFYYNSDHLYFVSPTLELHRLTHTQTVRTPPSQVT